MREAVEDRCPGVLRPYQSGDGALVRLRTPGGRFPATVLQALSRYAAAHGAPVLQLTSRGNLQLRGLPDPLPNDLEPQVRSLGLLPSSTHEVMRNIVVSPFEITPVMDVALAYDEGLRADPDLSSLPGRWLIAIDDGSGDVIGEPYDFAYQAIDPENGHVLAAGCPRTARVRRVDAANLLLELSRAFLLDRSRTSGERPIWNVRDLPDGVTLSPLLPDSVTLPEPVGAPSPGPRGSDVLAGVPLGMLEPQQADLIAELCGGTVVVTPWRSVLLPGAAPFLDRLRQAGLVVDAHNSASRVTACVGAPHCVRTASPTLQIARELADVKDLPAVHVSGCERRCGRPRCALDLLNPADTAQALAQVRALDISA